MKIVPPPVPLPRFVCGISDFGGMAESTPVFSKDGTRKLEAGLRRPFCLLMLYRPSNASWNLHKIYIPPLQPRLCPSSAPISVDLRRKGFVAGFDVAFGLGLSQRPRAKGQKPGLVACGLYGMRIQKGIKNRFRLGYLLCSGRDNRKIGIRPRFRNCLSIGKHLLVLVIMERFVAHNQPPICTMLREGFTKPGSPMWWRASF